VNQTCRDLIEAFRATEDKVGISQLSVLISDDADEGLDVEAIRVLGAWLHGEHRWKEPKVKCPDGGRPTPKAYGWMVSGMLIDYEEIADRANVTRTVARTKLAVILGARLIYADGTIAKAAKAAMESTIARRVRAKPQSPKKDPAPANKAN
jgi:hypothetical protein